jgi:TonB family protein
MAFSTLVNIGCAALMVFLSRQPIRQVTTGAPLADRHSGIIWLDQAGRGGGGGGSGDGTSEPPRKIVLAGSNTVTVPARKPLGLQTWLADVPPPIISLDIPAQTLASGLVVLPGAIDAPSGPPTNSQGPGRGGRFGSGVGDGDGPGSGSGLGHGEQRGTGGDVYRPGNHVTSPVPISMLRPNYTTAAMRARVQGAVLLECTVRPDGSVTDVQVARSLDPVFGLDDEAVRTARQWKFRPGTRTGSPVPVIVTIELTFTLR